jgi:hypothetical protein
LHPAFPVVYRNRCLDALQILLSPLRDATRRLHNHSVVSVILRLPIHFDDMLHYVFKKMKSYSNDEIIFLIYLSLISLLCLFTIIGKFFIAVIIILFFIINLKTISNFDLYSGYEYLKKRDRPKLNPQLVSNYYTKSTLNPIDIFQSVGSVALLGILVFAFNWLHLPLSFQLSIWGVCLWNLIMSEIHLYAKFFLFDVAL